MDGISQDDSSAKLGTRSRKWLFTQEQLTAKGLCVAWQPEGWTMCVPSGGVHAVLTVFQPSIKPADWVALLVGSILV